MKNNFDTNLPYDSANSESVNNYSVSSPSHHFLMDFSNLPPEPYLFSPVINPTSRKNDNAINFLSVPKNLDGFTNPVMESPSQFSTDFNHPLYPPYLVSPNIDPTFRENHNEINEFAIPKKKKKQKAPKLIVTVEKGTTNLLVHPLTKEVLDSSKFEDKEKREDIPYTRLLNRKVTKAMQWIEIRTGNLVDNPSLHEDENKIKEIEQKGKTAKLGQLEYVSYSTLSARKQNTKMHWVKIGTVNIEENPLLSGEDKERIRQIDQEGKPATLGELEFISSRSLASRKQNQKMHWVEIGTAIKVKIEDLILSEKDKEKIKEIERKGEPAKLGKLEYVRFSIMASKKQHQTLQWFEIGTFKQVDPFLSGEDKKRIIEIEQKGKPATLGTLEYARYSAIATKKQNQAMHWVEIGTAIKVKIKDLILSEEDKEKIKEIEQEGKPKKLGKLEYARHSTIATRKQNQAMHWVKIGTAIKEKDPLLSGEDKKRIKEIEQKGKPDTLGTLEYIQYLTLKDRRKSGKLDVKKCKSNNIKRAFNVKNNDSDNEETISKKRRNSNKKHVCLTQPSSLKQTEDSFKFFSPKKSSTRSSGRRQQNNQKQPTSSRAARKR